MASLDVSLDDMIKKNRKNNQRGGGGGARGGRGRGRPFGGGGGGRGGRRPIGPPRIRNNPLGVNARPSPYTIAKSFRRTKNLPWQNGMFEDSLKAAGVSLADSGTKLHITNLDFGVTNEDIRELFSEMGEIIRYAIHYDKSGRSSGSAEVVFERRSDAFQALKRYNNVQLDGKPMKIEIIGASAEIPLAARMNIVGAANGQKRTVVMASRPGRLRGGFISATRGSGQRGRGISYSGRGRGVGGGRGQGGGRGRGRGDRWRKKTMVKSADELDKELENYHSEAMQS